MSTRHIVLSFAVATLAVSAAQEPSSRFEVASIKQTEPPTPGTPAAGPVGFLPGGRYVARYMAPERLLVLAFREEGSGTGLRPEQIIGAPSWMASSRYNIDAKVAGPATADRIVDPLAARLLRSLLVERFKFAYHFEKRELPFYALVVDKADGSLGPNLKRSSPGCDAEWRERGAARVAGRAPKLPAPVSGRPVCAGLGLGSGRASGAGDMNTIASMLTGAAGSTVLDRTGLEGGFDLELRFAPERQSAAPGAVVLDPDAPSLFTAVREQLGLRLEQRRELRDVLMVDHIERPTPD